MPCTSPIQGYESAELTDKGKRKLVINRKYSNGIPMTTACGRCTHCRIAYSRRWAIRCVHEASSFQMNSFLTLTYDDAYLPSNSALVKKDFQDFMKRFRKKFQGFNAVEYKGKVTYPIRYFHCGEYGETYGRPHYHACIFNFDFPDKVFWKDIQHLYKSFGINVILL